MKVNLLDSNTSPDFKFLFNKDVNELVPVTTAAATQSEYSHSIVKPDEVDPKSDLNLDTKHSESSQLSHSNPVHSENIRLSVHKTSGSKTRSFTSSLATLDLKADVSFSAPRRVSTVLKVAITLCIVWFICTDVYDYYSRESLYSLYRFTPLLLVLMALAFDLQRSYGRQQVFFHSLWYIIGYLLMEDLLYSWSYWTLDLMSDGSNWFQHWDGEVLPKMAAFIGYSVSFQLIKRIARKFAIHSKQPDGSMVKEDSGVQWDNFNSFDLQFLFMMYSEYFLFQFITQNHFDLSFVGTLVLKVLSIEC